MNLSTIPILAETVTTTNNNNMMTFLLTIHSQCTNFNKLNISYALFNTESDY